MRLPSSTEISNLKSTQDGAMADLCNINHITFSSGTYGNTTETRTMVSGTACGIHFTNGQTNQRGQMLLIDYDVLLRLPVSQDIGLKDEVQLIEKGTSLVSGTFKLTSNPTINSTVQHVMLKRVAT